MHSKQIVNRAKRSSIVIMTNEARVLKELREAAGLSMRQAGELIGKSNSYISHLENGRMNIPSDCRLEYILQVYGFNMKATSFRERARRLNSKITVKDEIANWLAKASTEDAKIILKFIHGVL